MGLQKGLGESSRGNWGSVGIVQPVRGEKVRYHDSGVSANSAGSGGGNNFWGQLGNRGDRGPERGLALGWSSRDGRRGRKKCFHTRGQWTKQWRRKRKGKLGGGKDVTEKKNPEKKRDRDKNTSRGKGGGRLLAKEKRRGEQ